MKEYLINMGKMVLAVIGVSYLCFLLGWSFGLIAEFNWWQNLIVIAPVFFAVPYLMMKKSKW